MLKNIVGRMRRNKTIRMKKRISKFWLIFSHLDICFYKNFPYVKLHKYIFLYLLF